jgi:hypothetical protein
MSNSSGHIRCSLCGKSSADAQVVSDGRGSVCECCIDYLGECPGRYSGPLDEHARCLFCTRELADAPDAIAGLHGCICLECFLACDAALRTHRTHDMVVPDRVLQDVSRQIEMGSLLSVKGPRLVKRTTRRGE